MIHSSSLNDTLENSECDYFAGVNIESDFYMSDKCGGTCENRVNIRHLQVPST